MALLARIELDKKEAEELQKDLGVILDYVSKLKEAPVDEAQGPSFLKSPRTVLAPEISNVFRGDEPVKDESEVKKGEHVRVKHIL